ncbi:MAG: trimethylamine methyltransferase family protein [Spirochaetota bacterium]
MNTAELLTAGEVEQVHRVSLEILEKVGILVRNRRAREVFAAHGCQVDSSSGLVRLPAKVVEEYRRAFPPRFTFRGRDPRYDRTLPDDRPVVVTGSSAPDIIDPETGRERRADSTDIAAIAFLITELPGYDMFSISTLAADAPEGKLSLWRFYPALKNCLKPVRSNTPCMRELLDVLDLGALIAGGEDAYRERPIINHHYCPVVSPLTMDVESTEAVLYLTEKGLPVYGTIVPNGGVTAPMTLPGLLAQGNAEFLALGVLQQMVRPRTPLIYAVLSTVTDMRTGGYTPGAVETGILQAAHSQMARFYSVPSGGYIGLTNAHCNDAQSGYETGMSVTAALLGGCDLFNMGGLLGSLMVFDYAKAVIDNEIALMLKRLAEGMRFSGEALALDVVAETGPGGSFMESTHTLAHMREAAFFPTVAGRQVRQLWAEQGGEDAAGRALRQAKKILEGNNQAVLPGEVDARVRRRFSGLPRGEARWKR